MWTHQSWASLRCQHPLSIALHIASLGECRHIECTQMPQKFARKNSLFPHSFAHINLQQTPEPHTHTIQATTVGFWHPSRALQASATIRTAANLFSNNLPPITSHPSTLVKTAGSTAKQGSFAPAFRRSSSGRGARPSLGGCPSVRCMHTR